jgi:hypothetical protein
MTARGASPFALRLECDGKSLAYTGDMEWVDALISAARKSRRGSLNRHGRRRFVPDSALEQSGFEPSVPLTTLAAPNPFDLIAKSVRPTNSPPPIVLATQFRPVVARDRPRCPTSRRSGGDSWQTTGQCFTPKIR